MKRRAGLVGPLLAAGALLVACSGSPAEAPAGADGTVGGGEVVTGEGLTGSVTLYAAASLEAALTDVIAGFEEVNPGVTVEPPVYDGSSTLVTQLTEGAQADVFASADETTMDELVAAGLTVDEPQLFATNTLVIAVADGNPLGVTGLADLEGLSYAVCATGVPCGTATGSLFQAAGVTSDAVSQEQNVTAVAERVVSGEVDAGLVYATDVVGRGADLDAVVPDGAQDVVNRYPITTLPGSDDAAAALVAYVVSGEGQAVLAEHGFGSP